MSLQSYKLLYNSEIEPKAIIGTIVYDLRYYDYSLALDNTRATGIEHISVTLEPDGSYPFFTIPRKHLQPL